MSNPTLQEDLDYLKEIRRRHADADRDFIQYVLDPERVHLDRKILLRVVDSLSAPEPAGDALRALCDEIVTLTTMFRGQPDEHTYLPIEGHRAQKLYQKLDALRAAMRPATKTP